MRIWLCPSAFAPHRGGVEELTLKLAQHLQPRGHEVLVVTHREPAALPESEVVEGVRVARVRFASPGRSVAAATGFAADLAGVQRRLGRLAPAPDLVHVQCPSNQTAALTAFAARRRVPLVVTSQGEVVMDADGIYQRSAYLRAVLRWSSRRAAALSACSAWTVAEATRIAPAFAGATAIPNGVDPGDWLDVPPPVDAPVLCAWGRHVPQKGFDLLLAAMPLVLAALPEARLLLGGDGEETPRLRALAGPGVELVGPLDRAGVRELVGRARVVVVPSRIEPFGIVALEALAAGRQVVYTAGTGLSEAVGDAGIATDPADPAVFAADLVRALQAAADPGAARARAATLSWDAVTDAYEALYAGAGAPGGGP